MIRWNLRMENFRFFSRLNQNSRPRSWPPREPRPSWIDSQHHYYSEKSQCHHRFYQLVLSPVFFLGLLSCSFNNLLKNLVTELLSDLETSPCFKGVPKRFQAGQIHVSMKCVLEMDAHNFQNKSLRLLQLLSKSPNMQDLKKCFKQALSSKVK